MKSRSPIRQRKTATLTKGKAKIKGKQNGGPGMIGTSLSNNPALNNLRVVQSIDGDFGRSQLISRGRISTPMGARKMPEVEPDQTSVDLVSCFATGMLCSGPVVWSAV